MSAYAFDESRKVEPVSKYDFIPEVVFSGNKSAGNFYKWDNTGISNEWKGSIYFNTCPICESTRKQKIEAQGFDYLSYKLSNYLEKSERKLEYLQVWGKGEIELEFKIINGNKNATDNDGVIEVKLVADKSEFELVGTQKFDVNIGQTIKIKLKVNKITPYIESGSDSGKSQNMLKAPSIEFYAYDDTSSYFDFKGNVSGKILVGKFAILPWSCVNEGWSKVSPFIADSDFVVYTTDCLVAARAQIKKEKYRTADSGYSEDFDYAYLLYKDQKGRLGDKDAKGNPLVTNKPKDPIIYKEAFTKAVAYLKESMPNSIPVIVGVDHSQRSASYPSTGGDGTSDHFIVFVGMDKDNSIIHGNESTCYFYFFDNAVSNGYSTSNKIYSNCIENTMTSSATNTFISATGYKKYYVTQVRKSVKIK